MVAGFLSHLLTIFPFENPYFEKWGLPCTFVGHPTAEMGFERGDGAGFRDRYGLDAEQPLLCVLPGSRRAEVRRHLPVFKGTVRRLKARFPDLAVTVPTVATVRDEVASAVAAWPAPAVVTEGLSDKRDAFAAADLALAASGTVTYELAMAAVPMVITYRMSPLTVAVIRSMIRTKYVSVVNIVLGREVAPEFVQEDCAPHRLVPALAALLSDEGSRRRQREDLDRVARALGRGGPPSSETAAGVILSVVRSRMVAGV
jgi:lipid-A-disaccharide synthase